MDLLQSAGYFASGSASIPDDQPYPAEAETQALLLSRLHPGQLCNSCFAVPFKHLGFHHNILMEDLDKHFLDNERTLAEVFKNVGTCFFCRKLALLFQDYNHQSYGNLPFSELGLITVSITPKWLHSVEVDRDGRCEGRLLRLGIEYTFLGSKSTPDNGIWSPNFTFQRCNKPTLTVTDFCMDQDGQGLVENTQPYCGRVRPLVADTRLFRKWKEQCKSQHGELCDNLFTGGYVNRLRVIDAEKLCIVDALPGQDYIALSYVWGNVQMQQLETSNIEDLRQPGGLQLELLPATTADAIRVTLELGERYLWVDALCIIQDDLADKRYFVPIMDSVYGCALLTMIALSGQRSDSGLSGIRPGSRSREERPFSIRTTPIIASLDPARETSWSNYLGSSPWDCRGWTFQERIFSRRALIFASEQIYWECRNGSWCEDSIWEGSGPPHIHRKAFTNGNFLLPWSSDQSHFPRTYSSLVEKYSLRKLSFQSDALNAFAGILRALERTWGHSFFWGLPLSFLSSALQWKVEGGGSPTSILKRRLATIPHRTPNGEITQLPIPSWTWAGWESHISMANFDPQGMAIELKFFTMSPTEHLVAINESPAQQTRSEDVTLRRKWKKVPSAIVTLADLPTEALTHPSRIIFLYFWSSSALIFTHWTMDWWGNLRPVLGWWDSQIRFSWMQKPSSLPIPVGGLEGYAPGEIVCSSVGEFVVIGRDTHTSVGGCADMLMCVLVEREGDVVYRRGLVSIAEEDWVMLKFRWKLVVLG